MALNHQSQHFDSLIIIELRFVILLNSFQKKIQKTPKDEIEKALKLMDEYHEQKKNDMGIKSWKEKLKTTFMELKGTNRRDELGGVVEKGLGGKANISIEL